MCRGCDYLKDGEPTVLEYLDWFNSYQESIHEMKRTERLLHKHLKGLDDKKDIKDLDKLHKQMVRTRKEYAKLCDTITNKEQLAN